MPAPLGPPVHRPQRRPDRGRGRLPVVRALGPRHVHRAARHHADPRRRPLVPRGARHDGLANAGGPVPEHGLRVQLGRRAAVVFLDAASLRAFRGRTEKAVEEIRQPHEGDSRGLPRRREPLRARRRQRVGMGRPSPVRDDVDGRRRRREARHRTGRLSGRSQCAMV